MNSSLIIPNHVAIILDGNGRWASSRGLSRTEGHKKGANNVETICSYLSDLGVKYITLYAFSTENWKRPEEEVNTIMDLLYHFLSTFEDKMNKSNRKFRLRLIGSRDKFSKKYLDLFDKVEERTKNYLDCTVNIAINYGGREEIINTTKKLCQKVIDKELSLDDIDEKIFENNLYTQDSPPVDLLIRPGGEKRVSNYLLWQIAYAEFVFQDVLWPDYSKDDLMDAISEYSNRNRRYGGV